MSLAVEKERNFQKKHIAKHKSKYLSTDSLNRYNDDEGYKEKINLIKTLLDSFEGTGYILDVGANTAGESEILFHLGYNMVSTDINELALSYSKIRSKKFRNEEPAYYAADAHSLPFADDTFDKIIAFEALHHMERIETVLAELHRVLKPGGHLFAFEPYAYNPHRRLSEVRDYFRGTIEKSFSKRKVTRLFRTASFRIISVQKIVLPPSEWKKKFVSSNRVILKNLYHATARLMPWLFGSLVMVSKKSGTFRSEINFSLENRLVCPLTKSPLKLMNGTYTSTNKSGKRYCYPSYEGIPVLIKEDAYELIR